MLQILKYLYHLVIIIIFKIFPTPVCVLLNTAPTKPYTHEWQKNNFNIAL